MGIGVSAGDPGAQNLGANKPERATKSGWLAAGFVPSPCILMYFYRVKAVFSCFYLCRMPDGDNTQRDDVCR